MSFWTNPPYWIDFYKNLANGNEPPVIKFADAGPELIGPPRERFVRSLTGSVGQPLTLTLWARDQPPTTNVAEASAAEPAGGSRAARPRATSDNEPPPAIIGGRVSSQVGSRRCPTRARPQEPPSDAATFASSGKSIVVPERSRSPNEAIALMNGGDAKKFLEATTTATFSAPGEYWLRAQINDSSGDGGGGDQCCWTSAHVIVTVK